MKNQYLAVTFFMTFSMVACGNITEETEIEQSIVIVEDVQENIVEIEEEIVEETVEFVEVKEAVNTEIETVTELKSGKVEPKVKQEVVSLETQFVAVRASHDDWDELTKKYVTTAGKVNYKGMKSELSKINTYLKHLAVTSPKKDWSKNEKLAYWINLYNASTVHLIVSNYPTSSITKLSGGKPWDKKFVKSGTKTYSLNDIENVIVRPQFKDPRIHAALNCAAVSCPKLLNGAFLPSNLNAQLDKQSRVWVNDNSKNNLTPSKLKVSKIFEWYADDFKAGGGIVSFLSKYSIKKYLLDPKAKITYLEYDWALNE